MKIIRNWIDRIKFKIKLQEMDYIYYRYGGNCFGFFPPSFYYTHSQEEAKKIEEETILNLQGMIDEYRRELSH